MISNNSFLYSSKILVEIFFDILYFPFWWYSRGLFFLLKNIFEFLQNRSKSLALMVWIKNIFKPMYGQNDWQGFLISFVMRVFQIFVRSLIMLFWIVLSCGFVIIWIVFPFLVLYEIIFQVVTQFDFYWLWQLTANN